MSEAERQEKPKVWKTIGDEILFVNRVQSVTQLGAYLKDFERALVEFGSDVKAAYDLNTKGNGWVAAFPTPNRSITLSTDGMDPLLGGADILTEDFEAEVDLNPQKYDFLGKGIDGGFRISRNSSVEALTISPALAFLLCRAKRNVDTTGFDCRFVFHEPQMFKGMMNGDRYPVVSIITSRDQIYDELQDLEAKLLDRPREADFVSLSSYLEKYIRHHGIEKPELKLTARSADVDPPEHYQKYIREWKADQEQLQKTQELELSSATSGEDEGDRQTAPEVQKALDDVLKHFSSVRAAAPSEPASGIGSEGPDKTD